MSRNPGRTRRQIRAIRLTIEGLEVAVLCAASEGTDANPRVLEARRGLALERTRGVRAARDRATEELKVVARRMVDCMMLRRLMRVLSC